MPHPSFIPPHRHDVFASFICVVLQVLKVAKENSFLATGFLGGFLIGIAS